MGREMTSPQLPGLCTLLEPWRVTRPPLWAGLAAVGGGVTALAHTCSRWGIRPAASTRAVPQHCCLCWPPANELERANCGDMWKTAGLAWLWTYWAQTLICHCHSQIDQFTSCQQPVQPVGGGFLLHHQQPDLHWAGDRGVSLCASRWCPGLFMCCSYCDFLQIFFSAVAVSFPWWYHIPRDTGRGQGKKGPMSW